MTGEGTATGLARRLEDPAELAQLFDPQVLKRISVLLRGWCSGRSAQTKRARFCDLRQFAIFVRGEDEGAGVMPVRSAALVLAMLREGEEYAEAVVSLYIDSVRESGYADTTRARRITTLRSWAAHLRRKGVAGCDLQGVPVPRFDAYNNAEGAPIEVVIAVVAQLEEKAESSTGKERFLAVRDRAILVMLMLSFARRSELLGLNWCDIDADNEERTRLKVIAKGGRREWKDVGKMGADTLQQWNEEYVGRFGPPLASGPVFVSLNGDRLSQSRLYDIVKTLTGKGPHGMRHTGATALADDIVSAHEKLGHSSLDTTKVYIDKLRKSAAKGTATLTSMLQRKGER